MGYEDQKNLHENAALLAGNPGARYVVVPRYGSGEERVATFYDKIIEALTAPIAADEQQSGLYQPPAPPRILYEGTLDDAQDFFQQTTLIANCRNCPIATYTDGLPIIIPTEEKVAEMLTGTSHDPNETIGQTYPGTRRVSLLGPGGPTESFPTEAGTPRLYANAYTATVEKAAVCAVMAGCKPEYLPVVLAIAEAGGGSTNCPGTSSMVQTVALVSGPIAKEIGMNAGQEAFDIGNHANMSLGRVASLITVNFGRCIMGLIRSDSGNPMNQVCFAEDVDALPPGWEGYNEQCRHLDEDRNNVNYTKDESVYAKTGGQWVLVGYGDAPANYRQLITGEGGLAARILEDRGIPYGTPGYWNPLEGIVDSLAAASHYAPLGVTFILHPTVAQSIYDAGFKTKRAVEEWMTDINNYWTTVEAYRKTGFYQHGTDDGRYIGPEGIPWGEMPEDYKLAQFRSVTLIVSDGFADEHVYSFGGGGKSGYPIDPWR
jgi:hypothetical protein